MEPFVDSLVLVIKVVLLAAAIIALILMVKMATVFVTMVVKTSVIMSNGSGDGEVVFLVVGIAWEVMVVVMLVVEQW